jgi:hypothetical protein
LLAVDATEGVALTPLPSHVSPSSSAALVFNSDQVSGGVACCVDVQGADFKDFRFKIKVENPLIGKSIVSAFGSPCANVTLEYVDGSHCDVTCNVRPSAAAAAADQLVEVIAAGSEHQSQRSSSWSPLRISSFCCSSPLEPTAPHATPAAVAAALAAAGRPDVLVLQGCSADTVHAVISAFNVSLSSSNVLFSPPPQPSSPAPSSSASTAVALGGHVIITLADGAGLQLDAACSWEGQHQHSSCSAFAVPRVCASAPDVWAVSVNLSSFDIDVDKRMDAAHEDTMQSLCHWLHALMAARDMPLVVTGFFGIPAEDPVSATSSSSLSESADFSRIKSMLGSDAGVSHVIDVFRSSNAGGDAGLTWDYTQNSTIESFDRLFARDSFVFILNPRSGSSCSPVTCCVKPLGDTPATRLSPHFGLMAMMKLLAGGSG